MKKEKDRTRDVTMERGREGGKKKGMKKTIILSFPFFLYFFE